MKRPAFLLLLGAVLALLATGCIRAASSQGWASPVDAGSFLLVSTDKGELDAIDSATGTLLWRFPGTDAEKWLFPTDGASGSSAPNFPRLAAALSAEASSAELTGTSGVDAGKSVAIGGEIVGVFDLQGNLATLVRSSPVDHDVGEPVVPLRDKPPAGLDGIYADPLVVGNRIYVADYSGFVYAIEERTPGLPGRAVWYRQLGGNLIGDLALDEDTGTLFVPSSNGNLYALDTVDGTDALPAFSTGKRIWAGPVVASGTVYVASGDGKLYALDTATGESVWTPFEAGGDLMSQPVLVGDTLLVGSFDDRLYAIDLASGEPRWSYLAENWVWSRPLVADGTVYFADFDGLVYALDLADGAPLWDLPFNAAAPIRSGLVLVGDILVAATVEGDLWGIDPATGAPKWGPVFTGVSLESNLAVVGEKLIASPSGCHEVGEADLARRLNFLTIDETNGEVEASLGPQDC